MSRFGFGIFTAGCLATLVVAATANAQQCSPGGGGQGPSQTGFSMRGPTQSGFATQAGSQTGFSPQQGAQQAAAQLGAVQHSCSQIAANRRQERVQQAAYRAMMAELNRDRFQALAEAEQKRRDAIHARNRLRALAQDDEQRSKVATLTLEP